MHDGETFNVGYAYDPNSFASGPVGIDSVSVGDITINSMDVGAANHVGSAQQQPYGCILGLQ